MALTKVPSNLDATVAITQSASDNSTNVATTAYVTTAVSNLVDGAPAALNTLNEIAAALNDDAALNTTLTNSIATKLPLAGGTMTGDLTTNGDIIIDNSSGDPFLKLKTSAQEYVIRIDQSDSEKFQIRDITNSGTRITLDASGNVGIGTDDPGEKLEVNGIIQIKRVGDHPAMRFMEGGTTRAYMGSGDWAVNGGADDDFGISAASTGDLLFATVSGSEKMRIANGGNVGIGTDSPTHKLHVKSTSRFELTNGGIVITKTGGGVSTNNDYMSALLRTDTAGYHVTSNNGGFASTANALALMNHGDLILATAPATGSSSNYPSGRVMIKDTGNVGIGTPLPGQTLSVAGTIGIGTNASVGIGSTMADANIAELGPGYLNLARDDTADAKQISFSKNGVRVSDISTTDKGILWEVLESSGNAAAFQVTNGVGHTVWGAMNAQGHKWQDNVYNAFSAGGVSIGTDSSNTSHMWWNTYDTGSKHGVSAGYGMDEYVNNSTGDYSIRMSDNSSFVGDGIVLTERYRFTNKGALNIYATGSQQETNDAKIYVVKNSDSDWSISLIAGADDYGIRTRGNGAYAFGVISHNANLYRARIHYDGYIYSSDGAIHDIDSDVRLKEEIVAAPSQWQMIKDLPLQKFKWKDRRHGDIDSYGWIAQVVQEKYPEFVEPIPQTKEAIDAGEEDPEYLTVRSGEITRRALAALQEAMTRIETLEAEVASLKG